MRRAAAGTGSPAPAPNPTTPYSPPSPLSGANVMSHHGGPERLGGAGRRARSERPASASYVGASAACSGVLVRRAEHTIPSASSSFTPVSFSHAGFAYRNRLLLPTT